MRLPEKWFALSGLSVLIIVIDVGIADLDRLLGGVDLVALVNPLAEHVHFRRQVVDARGEGRLADAAVEVPNFFVGVAVRKKW